MKKMLQRFVSDDKGLETIEYAIMVGLIVVAVITTVGLIGAWVSGRFSDLESSLP
jgi:pilus assembly protein Flp/PilA